MICCKILLTEGTGNNYQVRFPKEVYTLLKIVVEVVVCVCVSIIGLLVESVQRVK